MHFYDYILLIVSLCMIVVVLLQKSEDSVAGIFSGERTELFRNRKSRGIEKVLDVSMLVLSILFVVLAIVSRIVGNSISY